MIWLTEILIEDETMGENYTWAGPNVEADTQEEAQEFCDNNGLFALTVIGELKEEIYFEEPCEN